MPIQKYPNRNATLEKRWNKDINRRWKKAWRRIKALEIPRLLVNLSMTEEQQVQSYIDQIREIIQEEIFEATWQNEYQRLSYERSMETAQKDILSMLASEEAAAIAFVLAKELNFSDAHRREFDFLTGRANEKLAGYRNLFLTDLTGLVRDNIGRPIHVIDSLIKERFFKIRKAAKRIATTELNQAAQRAAMIRSLEIQEATGLKTELRWVSANDSRVRHLHAGWHGKIFDRDQASINMQISPWNCRCKLQPVVETRIPARTNARFAKERKALLASEEK